jgi:hypothetical protein
MTGQDSASGAYSVWQATESAARDAVAVSQRMELDVGAGAVAGAVTVMWRPSSGAQLRASVVREFHDHNETVFRVMHRSQSGDQGPDDPGGVLMVSTIRRGLPPLHEVMRDRDSAIQRMTTPPIAATKPHWQGNDHWQPVAQFLANQQPQVDGYDPLPAVTRQSRQLMGETIRGIQAGTMSMAGMTSFRQNLLNVLRETGYSGSIPSELSDSRTEKQQLGLVVHPSHTADPTATNNTTYTQHLEGNPRRSSATDWSSSRNRPQPAHHSADSLAESQQGWDGSDPLVSDPDDGPQGTAVPARGR